MTMNEKSNILQALSNAKIAHMRWVKRTDHLISGLPVDKEFIPLEATECGFGKWLYTIGSDLRSDETFKYLIEQIEFHHDNLHSTYMSIYKIYFLVPENRSLLHKIMTFNSHDISKSEKELAQKYYTILQKSSNDLLDLLDKFDIEVRSE
jgi:hypothetical protein